MIYYQLGKRVEARSTNIGEESQSSGIITPTYQAHSTNVAVIPDDLGATHGIDALITDTVGVGIGVRTADCVPVLLYDGCRHAAAAIHSGWKGTLDGIISCAVTRMHERYGCRNSDIKAVIGPCIHVEAFEVGDEVYEAFRRRGYGAYCRRMANPYHTDSVIKWHIDLPAICHEQLSALGTGEIHVCPYCTYRHHDTLYSYRYSHCADASHRIITSITLL